MLPVQPTGPAISLELDVDDGEVENYEVCLCLFSLFSVHSLDAASDPSVFFDERFPPTGPPEPR